MGQVRHSETLGSLVLYDCLYKNELGSHWVRPSELFFSEIEIDGKKRPRFEKVNLRVSFHSKLSGSVHAQVLGLSHLIFNDFDKNSFEARLQEKKIALFTVSMDQSLVGFKLGYETNPNVFYSWLGGVQPDFRGWGIGKALLDAQHQWCQQQGYKEIQTKTKNQWQAMLVLNIRSGFQIVATELAHDGDVKILMKKVLSNER